VTPTVGAGETSTAYRTAAGGGARRERLRARTSARGTS